MLQHGTEIIPIETKGGEDKSAPSFKRYIAEHHPKHAIRFSKRGYRTDGAITNIPSISSERQRTCFDATFRVRTCTARFLWFFP